MLNSLLLVDIGRTTVVATLELFASQNSAESYSHALVNEILDNTADQFSVAYSTAVCKLINCLILSLPDASSRQGMRESFRQYGLGQKLELLRTVDDPGRWLFCHNLL